MLRRDCVELVLIASDSACISIHIHGHSVAWSPAHAGGFDDTVSLSPLEDCQTRIRWDLHGRAGAGSVRHSSVTYAADRTFAIIMTSQMYEAPAREGSNDTVGK